MGVLRIGSDTAADAKYCTECGGALMPAAPTPDGAGSDTPMPKSSAKSGLMAWLKRGHPLVIVLKWLGLLIVVGQLAVIAFWGLVAGLCLGAAAIS